MVDLDEGVPRPLTRNSYSDVFPTWFPNGKQIAFVSDRDGDDEIYLSGVTDAIAVVHGGAGNDIIHGTATLNPIMIDGENESDQLFGDGGNDFLFGEAGPDQLFGGIGIDMLDGAELSMNASLILSSRIFLICSTL